MRAQGGRNTMRHQHWANDPGPMANKEFKTRKSTTAAQTHLREKRSTERPLTTDGTKQTADEKRQMLKHLLHKNVILWAVEKKCSLDHGKFLSSFSLWKYNKGLDRHIQTDICAIKYKVWYYLKRWVNKFLFCRIYRLMNRYSQGKKESMSSLISKVLCLMTW